MFLAMPSSHVKPAEQGRGMARNHPAGQRGVLSTPFHNMALMSPVTQEADVGRHTETFAAATADLLGSS
jgi:hypothetical protein